MTHDGRGARIGLCLVAALTLRCGSGPGVVVDAAPADAAREVATPVGGAGGSSGAGGSPGAPPATGGRGGTDGRVVRGHCVLDGARAGCPESSAGVDWTSHCVPGRPDQPVTRSPLCGGHTAFRYSAQYDSSTCIYDPAGTLVAGEHCTDTLAYCGVSTCFVFGDVSLIDSCGATGPTVSMCGADAGVRSKDAR